MISLVALALCVCVAASRLHMQRESQKRFSVTDAQGNTYENLKRTRKSDTATTFVDDEGREYVFKGTHHYISTAYWSKQE